MEGMEEGVIGSYRPATDFSSLPDPPQYSGNGKDPNDLEVKIAPSKDEMYRNGDARGNGTAPTDGDDRWEAAF